MLEVLRGMENSLSNVRLLEVCDVPSMESYQLDHAFVDVKKMIELENDGVPESRVNRVMKANKRVEATKKKETTGGYIIGVVGIAVLAGMVVFIRRLLFH